MVKSAFAAVMLALCAAQVSALDMERMMEDNASLVAPVALADAGSENLRSPVSVSDLARYITARATPGNDFDEQAAIGWLYKVGTVSPLQEKLLRKIFNFSSYGNSFNEIEAFRRVLLAPHITVQHAALLSLLLDRATYENNFDENWAFSAVLTRKSISNDALRSLRDIVLNASYGNGISEDKVFAQVLNTQPAL